MSRLYISILSLAFVALVSYGVYYTISECGFGAFAYKNPLIAAITGQCK